MNNCNGSRNELLIIAAANYARKIMSFNEPIWIFINEGKMFKSKTHSGIYEKDSFSIRFNRDWLKTATDEKIVKCAFHEVFHAVQHVELLRNELGISSKLFTEEQLIQIELEFKDENYNDSIGVYENLLVEIQADEFANFLYCKFMKESIIIEDFIDIYYILYVNSDVS